MIKFALGVSVTVNVLVVGAAYFGHTTEGAKIINLYLKQRGYLAPRD